MTQHSVSAMSDPSTDSSANAPTEHSSAEVDSKPVSALSTKPTPLRCFTGAFIAAPLGYGLYVLTRAIAQTFAEKPVSTANALATKISILVRTLVVGVGALGTGIFAITTLGLVLLGLQLLFKKTDQKDAA
ncbi:MAG: DUF3082 domain-containing protein [Leptolyngbyaceae bacterium]|nr:DUF3082 domain-containing protein [Leptolyngbyaceae bacterium]